MDERGREQAGTPSTLGWGAKQLTYGLPDQLHAGGRAGGHNSGFSTPPPKRAAKLAKQATPGSSSYIVHSPSCGRAGGHE